MKKSLLVIYTSNNRQGNSACLADWALEAVNTEHYEIERVYLYDLTIDPFTNENRGAELEQDPRNKDMHDLAHKIEEADRVIVTYPVWNFGVPGIFKNMLDRASFSGRVWSETKQKKVPGWGGKRYYLLFTQGAPWYGVALNMLAVLQVSCTLWYFGASVRLLGFAAHCGNGSKCMIHERTGLKKRIQARARKIFC